MIFREAFLQMKLSIDYIEIEMITTRGTKNRKVAQLFNNKLKMHAYIILNSKWILQIVQQ